MHTHSKCEYVALWGWDDQRGEMALLGFSTLSHPSLSSPSRTIHCMNSVPLNLSIVLVWGFPTLVTLRFHGYAF